MLVTETSDTPVAPRDSSGTTPFPRDPAALAAAIDIDLADWPGNCHGVALAVLRLVPVRGMRLARGVYTGPVSRRSVYRGGPQQHSWLVLADGRILDPTRWAMETPSRPAIYLGPCDHYDEGGRAGALARPPLLAAGPDRALAAFEKALSAADAPLRADLRRALGCGDVDPSIPRLAEMLRDTLQDDADALVHPRRDVGSLYRIAEALGLKAMIPIDSWHRVMEPDRITCRRDANRYFELPPATRPDARELFARLLLAFCLIEHRAGLEDELAEFDITLESYHAALTRFERWDLGLAYLPLDDKYIIGIAITELLGKGYGATLRVERYAASLGYPGEAFLAAHDEVCTALWLSTFW